MARIVETTTTNDFTINKVPSQAVFEDMIENDQVNENELYLIEGDPLSTVDSVNGKTGVVVLDASDVGALPDDTVFPVSSVNGQTGAVVLDASDVGALPDTTVIPVASVNGQTGAVVLTATDVGALPNTTVIPVSSVNGQTGVVVLDADDVGALPDDTAIPEKTSDLTNDSGFITGMEILSYGSSTWANFEAAYTAQKVVYCRASSNSNPASGSQTRLAFMAYVNNAATPTEVEFQYYRSVSSHTASQQGDQVYVYKLTKTGGWSVTVREASVKVAAGTNMSLAYSNGTATLNFAGTIPSTAADVGAIAAPSSPTTGAFLVWDGTAWVAQTMTTWQGGSY